MYKKIEALALTNITKKVVIKYIIAIHFQKGLDPTLVKTASCINRIL